MASRGPSSRLGQPAQQVAQIINYPASVGGINALNSLAEMPPNDCIYCYNIMPSEYGIRLRKGYREWATGVNGDVRSLLNYEGNSTLTNDKLWAVSENGIYDVTVDGTTVPVEDATFTVQGDAAGWGVTAEFTNDAAEHFFYYADELNGLWVFEEGVGWAVPAGWTYEDPDTPDTQIPFPVEDIAFVTVHKLRIWVVLRDSDDGWYLPVASIAGELQKFTFGSKMIHGGRLMGLWSWSIDGGDGLDDYFVGVARSGDIAVYRGSDPTALDWAIVGTWFIGQTTNSRRAAAPFAAELYILSAYGITSLRDLLQGTAANMTDNSPSRKITRYLRADIEAGINRYEWQINVNPSDGFLQIITPEPSSTPYLQYNQNISTRAWGTWRDVPMLSADHWVGKYFLGGKAGVVYIYDGALDGVTIAAAGGEPIEFSILTSFQSPAQVGTYKRVGVIRPVGLSSGNIALNTNAVYDYNIEEQVPAPPIPPPTAASNWDSSFWDIARWDFAITSTSVIAGSFGTGRAFAIGMAGVSDLRITVIGWDVSFDMGGML